MAFGERKAVEERRSNICFAKLGWEVEGSKEREDGRVRIKFAHGQEDAFGSSVLDEIVVDKSNLHFARSYQAGRKRTKVKDA